MVKIKDISMIILMVLGGIIAGETTNKGVRYLSYNHAKSNTKTLTEFKKYERKLEECRNSSYVTMGIVGGLVGVVWSKQYLNYRKISKALVDKE